MRLQDIRLVHLPKARSEGSQGVDSIVPESFARAFYLETCLRRIWVGSLDDFGDTAATYPAGSELFCGTEAYRFLLRVTTGLESAIPGEADIFGQAKEAWKTFEAQSETRPNPLVAELREWIMKLFEDTKVIRSEHLRGMGPASYGSIVRKLLQRHGPTSDQPILIVGAGQLARSIAPYLTQHRLLLWNRTPENAQELRDLLALEKGARVDIVAGGKAAELLAWQEARHVVVCIPLDPKEDPARMEAWYLGNRDADFRRTVVHLGGFRAKCGAWTKVPDFYALDDLFAFQNRENQERPMRLAQAQKACHSPARVGRPGAFFMRF